MNGKDRIKQALNFSRSDRLPVAYEAEWEVTTALVKYFKLDEDTTLRALNISSFHSPVG